MNTMNNENQPLLNKQAQIRHWKYRAIVAENQVNVVKH